MNNPVIKGIKDKWLDCEKLSEKDEALLFARIEKLEDELAAQQSVQRTGYATLTDIAIARADAILQKRRARIASR